MRGASSRTARPPTSLLRRDPLRLLLTRPEPDAARTAAALRAAGHEVLTAPMLRIEPVAADLGAGPWEAVLITSANAARAVAAHPRRRDQFTRDKLIAKWPGDPTASERKPALFDETSNLNCFAKQ